MVKSVENPSLLVQVFQEEVAKTGLGVQRVHWEKTPVEDKRGKSRENCQTRIYRSDPCERKRGKKDRVGSV